MIEIETKMVSFGKTAGYLARPKGTGIFSGLLVIQEWWGINEHIKDISERFSREGFVALAPDLYHGKLAKSADEAGKLMQALNQDSALEDLSEAAHYLENQDFVNKGSIGVTGFCMGGTYALLLACRDKRIRASVPFYGQIPDEKTLSALSCPLLYIYGSNDGWIKMEDVNRLDSTLKKFKKQGVVKIYTGAPHAFFNDTRPDVYRPTEAKDAWQRALRCLRENL